MLMNLQNVVRDLWALRLQKHQSRATYDSETDTEAQRSEMFSSQSEGESGTDAATLNSQRSRHASRKKPGGPGLLDLICLEYVGAMLLKIPLTVADLHQWVNGGKLLYYRAAKEVPLAMRIHLPGHLQEQLEPQSTISPDSLHRTIFNILSSLHAEFGMAAPSLNHPLVLYRWVRELALPLEIFVAVQRLGQTLELDYSYSLNAQAGTNQSLRYPEVRLMALVIITTKLLFPFDSIRRYAKTPNDLSVLKVDWESWTNIHTSYPSPEKDLTFVDAFNMTEADIINLGDGSLDQYLEWCEANIASEEIRDRGRAGREADFRRALFEWFPSSAPSRAPRAGREGGEPGSDTGNNILRAQQALRAQRVFEEDGSDDIPRAGTMHAHSRSADELEGASKAFHEKASRAVGFSCHGMVRAVVLLERQIMRHEKLISKRKQED